MLRILKKTTSSMAKSGGSVPGERYGSVDEDLSAWEFVNASQSDDEDRYSFDDEEGAISGGDDVTVEDEEPESKPDPEEEEGASEPCAFVTPADVISIQSLLVSPPMTRPVEMNHSNPYRFEGKGRRCYGENDDGSDDDGDDALDYDDELMPWKLKDRFGKQKMRKMGKKGGPSANNSKRLPYYYNLPGTVYGKVRC